MKEDVLCKRGEGVVQDYEAAVKWYRLAAEQGCASALCNLALKYDKGQGVIQDNVTTNMWFNIAASNSNADAANKIGI